MGTSWSLSVLFCAVTTISCSSLTTDSLDTSARSVAGVLSACSAAAAHRVNIKVLDAVRSRQKELQGSDYDMMPCATCASMTMCSPVCRPNSVNAEPIGISSWRGCVPVPKEVEIWPNSVAPLPGGGGIALAGGNVAIWRLGKGWKSISELKGIKPTEKIDGHATYASGVEVSRDGRWLFVAVNDSSRKGVMRFAVDGSAKSTFITLAASPSDAMGVDNLCWGDCACREKSISAEESGCAAMSKFTLRSKSTTACATATLIMHINRIDPKIPRTLNLIAIVCIALSPKIPFSLQEDA